MRPGAGDASNFRAMSANPLSTGRCPLHQAQRSLSCSALMASRTVTLLNFIDRRMMSQRKLVLDQFDGISLARQIHWLWCRDECHCAFHCKSPPAYFDLVASTSSWPFRAATFGGIQLQNLVITLVSKIKMPALVKLPGFAEKPVYFQGRVFGFRGRGSGFRVRFIRPEQRDSQMIPMTKKAMVGVFIGIPHLIRDS